MRRVYTQNENEDSRQHGVHVRNSEPRPNLPRVYARGVYTYDDRVRYVFGGFECLRLFRVYISAGRLTCVAYTR